MFKKSITLGATAGVLAGIASIIYQKVYASSLGEGFSSIVKPFGILAISILAGLVAAIVFYFLTRALKSKGEAVFNFVLVILSFASILFPFAMKLPLDIESPELFPGLVVPMHFFPALAWFTLKPLFIRPDELYKKVFG
jgi:hypothetical protein